MTSPASWTKTWNPLFEEKKPAFSHDVIKALSPTGYETVEEMHRLNGTEGVDINRNDGS